MTVGGFHLRPRRKRSFALAGRINPSKMMCSQCMAWVSSARCSKSAIIYWSLHKILKMHLLLKIMQGIGLPARKWNGNFLSRNYRGTSLSQTVQELCSGTFFLKLRTYFRIRHLRTTLVDE